MAADTKGMVPRDWDPQTFWFGPGASGHLKGIDIFAWLAPHALHISPAWVLYRGDRPSARSVPGGARVAKLRPSRWPRRYRAQLGRRRFPPSF